MALREIIYALVIVLLCAFSLLAGYGAGLGSCDSERRVECEGGCDQDCDSFMVTP